MTTFKRVGGQKKYVKPKDCKAGELIVQGKYLGRSPNKFGNDNFDFRPDDGGPTVCINHAGHLAYIMEENVSIGDTVQVVYKGKEKLENGAFKGKESHQFDVLVAEDDLLKERPVKEEVQTEMKISNDSDTVDLSDLD